MDGRVLLAPVAALGAVALALALGRIAFWVRHFSRRNPAQRDQVARGALEPGSKLPAGCDPLAEIDWTNQDSPERARLLAEELLSAGGRRLVLLDGVTSLAALVGLAETFVALRGLPAGSPVEPGRLIWAFSAALSGLGVFVGARVALALFRAWESALRLEVGLALQSPRTAPAPLEARFPRAESPGSYSSGAVALDELLWSVPSPQAAPRKPRRPWTPAARDQGIGGLRGAAVFAACLFGSVLFHSGIFYLARHLDSATSGPKKAESDGVFFASLVRRPTEPEPVRLQERKEEPAIVPEPPPAPPPPPPPPPPPAPKEPPPEPPKAPELPKPPEVREKEPPTEEPKPVIVEKETKETKAPAIEKETKAAVIEKETKPVVPPDPPSAPPAPAAARESEAAPEPPAPAAPKVKESAATSPEPPAQPRYTENPKAVTKEAEAPPEPPAGGRSGPPGPASPSPAALGFGDNPPEKSAGASESDGRGGGGDIATIRDYRRFLAREMKSGAPEGQYVPNLRFGDNKAQENREIMRYFGMELIAYPKNQKFYVYIDPEQGLFSRSSDFTYIRNFSTRVIFRNSPYFDALRAEAAKRVGVDASTLVVAQLLKPSSAAYIGWKERETAKRAGVALEDVDACDATFARTPFGVWIVRIDRLLLRDGRTLAVQDFEWAKVSAGKAGDP